MEDNRLVKKEKINNLVEKSSKKRSQNRDENAELLPPGKTS